MYAFRLVFIQSRVWSDSRRGFGLDIGFIDHLQVVTTNNTNTITITISAFVLVFEMPSVCLSVCTIFIGFSVIGWYPLDMNILGPKIGAHKMGPQETQLRFPRKKSYGFD
jgi:hypothetical protein